MKKFLLASAALIAFGLPASAADLAVKAPMYKAPPPIPVFSWTGCYVGGNVGGVWAHKEWTNTDPFFFPGVAGWGTHDQSSFIGGFQAGCDYQFAGGFVIGIAGDYDWTNAKANSGVLFPALAGFSTQAQINNLASVTGRIGYAWDRFLGYVKGGGAWERDNYALFNAAGVTVATASETRGGWTVGIGGEYAFTNWISAFAEYDYYNFGTRGNTLVCGAVGCFAGLNTARFDVKDTKSVFKVGLNFRFGGYNSVVARY
jgi:outer membrane immunogenic protein